jgi:nucleotide-binding universal stress UspA family protein
VIAAKSSRRADHADVGVDTLFQEGMPAEIITRIADERGAMMIVVGSRGLGKASHLLGSTSEAVLARSSVPVLIVPSATSAGAPPDSNDVAPA